MPCLDDGDNSRRGLPSVLELRRVPQWSLGPLRSVRKVKVISFLLGLTLTFLIMASYILTWDKKGLMLTLSPFHLRTIVNPSSTLSHNLSSTKDYANIKLLVKCITSKLEFSPRKLPPLKDVVNTDSHVSMSKVSGLLFHVCRFVSGRKSFQAFIIANKIIASLQLSRSV